MGTHVRRFTRTPLRLIAMGVVGGLLFAACSTDGDAPIVDEPPPATEPGLEPEPAPDRPEASPDPAGDPELIWSVDVDTRVDRVAMHPDGEVVATAEDATYLRQLADGALVDAVIYTPVGVGTPDDLAYSADGSFLLAGLHVNHVVVSGSDGEILLELPAGFESRVAISADASMVATSHRSGEVHLWDATADSAAGTFTVEERAVLPPPDADGPMAAGVATIAFHPDGDLLVVQNNDEVARVWDLGTLEQVAQFELAGESFQVPMMRISPDGSMVAAAVQIGQDQHIRVWTSDVLTDDTLAPVAEFEVLTRVRDLSWSPDGALLAVASRLGTTIWDPVAGELAYTFDETFDATASEQPLAVSFTPDGGHLIVSRGTHVIELWRLPGAEELAAPARIACDPIPLPGDVLFATGSADLRGEAEPVLDELAAELAATYDTVTLTFVGHTDSRGSAEANLTLSTARAESVAAWFAEWAAANDADGWELRTDGRGDTELRVDDVDANGQFLEGAGQLNRRVEIEIETEGC